MSKWVAYPLIYAAFAFIVATLTMINTASIPDSERTKDTDTVCGSTFVIYMIFAPVLSIFLLWTGAAWIADAYVQRIAAWAKPPQDEPTLVHHEENVEDKIEEQL